jgi:hypothetical protein
MPTARELLEQADRLMRRNRKRGRGRDGGPPTLTDALGIDRAGALPPTLILPAAGASEADPIALDTLSDLPVLTDVVEEWPSAPRAQVLAEEASVSAVALDDALDPAADQALADALVDEIDDATLRPVEADAIAVEAVVPAQEAEEAEETRVASVENPAADVAASQPGSTSRLISASDASPPTPVLDEEFILEIPPLTEAQPPDASQAVAPAAEAPLPQPTLMRGSPEWDALAEEIRMQVLQRLDLFTDTGMRDQLGARLQPIVARASAELVETINHALGELVRGYVAEAIEREIESWRERSG